MNEDNSSKIDRPSPSRDDIKAWAKELATPVDVDGLIAEGVLEKAGDWYRILDFSRLPTSVKMKVAKMKDGGLIKFRKPSVKLKKFLKDDQQ